ncbi:MAG TPA: hypothetical protein VGV67_07480 [Solirubrobacteraceae bacterium]|nr:hypothetical protein [Solirubrobacteraceae bacterium]
MNPVSDLLREQAAAHRATAGEKPDDPRYASSAEALEALAAYADKAAEEEAFPMRFLLEHHVADDRFLWRDGQCGRAISAFGFDVPVSGEWDLEQFLMDLCSLAKSDATRYIGEHESDFERADATAIAARFGISAEDVHHALDTGRRYARLFIVGIPDDHPVGADARAGLEAIDGVLVAPGATEQYGDAPPLLVKNVPAGAEDEARERVAQIVGIDPRALGVTESPRVFEASY